jgi:hypothetical protein
LPGIEEITLHFDIFNAEDLETINWHTLAQTLSMPQLFNPPNVRLPMYGEKVVDAMRAKLSEYGAHNVVVIS